ncbi:hypothetical protein LCGC14_2281280 [marine sediment metagenome]|uniref:Uncharacterized protein n=1 Tax=marine sediment metagenome TaxID=412755 RepID=A0A0F9DGE2_9ZZZZ
MSANKFNYFEILTVPNTDFGIVADFGFVSAGFLLALTSSGASDIVYYSFDQLTIHGVLQGGTVFEALAFDSRHESKIWFALDTGESLLSVRVEAWA